ncbi:MAG: transcription antitermination factor NusB [Fluviibacter sp.]
MTQPPNHPGKPANGPKPARRRAREAALQALYGWQVGSQDLAACETALHEIEGFNQLRDLEQGFAKSLLRGAIANQESLREQLTPLLDRPFAELSPVEACVLLIGAQEMANSPETPLRVVLNEAIELAKTFGGTDGHKFVNGVLDRLAPTLRPLESTRPTR